MYNLIEKKDLQNEGIVKDLEKILKIVPSYLEIIQEQTVELHKMFREKGFGKHI